MDDQNLDCAIPGNAVVETEGWVRVSSLRLLISLMLGNRQSVCPPVVLYSDSKIASSQELAVEPGDFTHMRSVSWSVTVPSPLSTKRLAMNTSGVVDLTARAWNFFVPPAEMVSVLG